MRAFRKMLADRAVDPKKRRWIYVPYDQLTSAVGPLARSEPRRAGIVLVEAPAKAARRPYHKQKLLLVLANQRHFALEQAERGVAVKYLVAEKGYAEALRPLGPLTMMEAAERELRRELARLDNITVEPHEGWLTTNEDFHEGAGSPSRMDAFYRHVRRRTGILMKDGKPIGGKLSFDTENRKPWKGEPRAPKPLRFAVDAVTKEIVELLETRFAEHPGTLDPESCPATLADAERLWTWALAECLPSFGPFEDAMSTQSSGLFHTRISGLLNLHRLLPKRIVDDVVAKEELPLASREGFVRQVLGWREYVRHVHRETDGFRSATKRAPLERPGDGGFGAWRDKAWKHPAPSSDGDGGARPSFLAAKEPLPGAYWGDPSGLACLDHVVEDVWREGWSHHISRLMVLSNLATLLGIEPRDLTDWFWVAYIDAYDWVVEPNVLAMGTYGVGELMTTKPYVSGAAYIHRMSDYCGECAFDPKSTCPITRLYWSFLARNEAKLAGNGRLFHPLNAARKRPPAEKAEDQRILERVREGLARRELLTPESLVRERHPGKKRDD